MSRTLKIIAVWLLAMFVLAQIADSWMGLSISMNGELLEPIIGFFIVGIIAVALVALGFVVTLSVLGLIAFVIASVVLGVFFAGLSVMWPVLLVVGIIYLATRSKEKSYS